MSKYNGLKRDQLEELVVEKLNFFLKYLDGQSSYPMGKFPTGIPSPNGGEYLVWVGCSEGTISFSLQDTTGVDYHNIKIDKFGTIRKIVDLTSSPFKENGKIWFAKSYSIRCDADYLDSNSDFFLKQLPPKIRKKDQVLAYWLGLTAIQDYC
jgi:hypothetical protein